MSLTLADVLAARQRIADVIYLSPCPQSVPLSEICESDIYCKLDYLQRTGSFKERGARNALLLLTKEQRETGIVAASAGNHALGLAYHGMLLGIGVTVVMPRFAPLIKVTTCRRLGAKVILEGDSYAEARELAQQLGASEGLSYIHGFDDPAIIAGQGTLGLEVLEQVPEVEAIVVPVGGGGLLAGVSLAVKSIRPDVKIVGVEPQAAASMTAAMRAGQPSKIRLAPTLADGLAVDRVGALAFEIARDRVDSLVTVSEESISLAILRLIELEKSVVEGAGAASLAAAMAHTLPELLGRKVVLLLCGGNIDLTMLDRVIERGLVTDGRLCRFSAVVRDRPGGLAHLCQLIANQGASVKEITHDRAFSGPDISSVNVLCTVETADRAQIDSLYAELRKAGIAITAWQGPGARDEA